MHLPSLTTDNNVRVDDVATIVDEDVMHTYPLYSNFARTPLDPEISFGDDPLRMLRAFRFASQLDFRIAPEVLESVSRLKEKLRTVSAERIADEVHRRVPAGPRAHPQRGLQHRAHPGGDLRA